MRVLATKVPDDVYEAFRERASEEGMSIAALLRKLIYDYLGLQEGRPEVNPGLPSREEFEELKRRVEELERELKRVAGIGYCLRGKPR